MTMAFAAWLRRRHGLHFDLAAALGGYNHVRLRPELERDPGGHEVTTRVRRSLAVEAVTMLVVVVLTAWLVTAAT